MRCREFVDRSTDFLEEALGPADRLQAAAHLSACKHCRTYVDQLMSLQRIARSLFEDDAVPQSSSRRAQRRRTR